MLRKSQIVFQNPPSLNMQLLYYAVWRLSVQRLVFPYLTCRVPINDGGPKIGLLYIILTKRRPHWLIGWRAWVSMYTWFSDRELYADLTSTLFYNDSSHSRRSTMRSLLQNFSARFLDLIEFHQRSVTSKLVENGLSLWFYTVTISGTYFQRIVGLLHCSFFGCII